MLKDNRTGTIYWSEYSTYPQNWGCFWIKSSHFHRSTLIHRVVSYQYPRPLSETSTGESLFFSCHSFFLNTIFTKTWEIKYDWKCWRKHFFRMNFLLLKASHHLSQCVVFTIVPLWVQSNEYSSLTVFIKWHTKNNYTLEGQYKIQVKKVKFEVF